MKQVVHWGVGGRGLEDEVYHGTVGVSQQLGDSVLYM